MSTHCAILQNKCEVHPSLYSGDVLALVRTGYRQLGLVWPQAPHQRDLGVDKTAEDADVQPNEVDPPEDVVTSHQHT